MRKNIIFLLVSCILLTLTPTNYIYAMQSHVEDIEIEDEIVLLDKDEIDIVALVCLGEAEGESELGKRLVIDTILNRCDSSKYPDNVTDVCWQKGQFSCLHNGRCSRLTVTDDIRQLVIEECIYRTNSDVMYFAAGGYNGRTPLLREGGHYFSK